MRRAVRSESNAEVAYRCDAPFGPNQTRKLHTDATSRSGQNQKRRVHTDATRRSGRINSGGCRLVMIKK